MIMQSTKVRLPNAPMVRPIIDISKLSVGHDLANLKTLNCGFRLQFQFQIQIQIQLRLWCMFAIIFVGGCQVFQVFCNVA